MTRVLALDTSAWWGGVALVERDGGADGPIEVVAELGLRIERSHADRLLQRVDGLLTEAGWERTAIDLYVGCVGPGSFTGIRVGLGTIRGFALATGRTCVGETSLSAIAEAHGPDERERVVVIEAGRGELYGARFDAASSPPVPLDEPWLRARDALDTPELADAVIVPGTGTPVDHDRVPRGSRIAAAPRATAAAAGRLALLRTEPQEGRLAPLYIRPPDAWLKRRRS